MEVSYGLYPSCFSFEKLICGLSVRNTEYRRQKCVKEFLYCLHTIGLKKENYDHISVQNMISSIFKFKEIFLNNRMREKEYEPLNIRGRAFQARGNCKCKILVCSTFSKKIRGLDRSEQVGVQ